MQESDSQNTSAEFMRLAIPLMNQHGISVTPQNYAVWYEYVAGTNLPLKEAIDTHIIKQGSIDDTRTKELYGYFLESGKEQHDLIMLRQELRRLVEEVLVQTTKGVEAASGVAEQLADNLIKMHPNMSREQVSIVIKDVIAETREFMVSGTQITSQLNAAAHDIEVLKSSLDIVKQQATTDYLTSLENRRSFDTILPELIRQAEHDDSELSIIFCDLDLFENINSKHGHFVGDQVLKVVAKSLKSLVKGRDRVARYGGQEFIIALPLTQLEDALKLADVLRLEIASKRIQRKDTKEPIGEITMSFGVASYFKSEGLESFLQRADRALYQSKQKGRNSVTEAKPPII